MVRVLWGGVVNRGVERGAVEQERYDGFVKQQSVETLCGRELEDRVTELQVDWGGGYLQR